MANVAHSTLTGADLHEPKGVAAAAANTIYVANGSGSGTWTTLSSLQIPGVWKLINTYTPSSVSNQGITGFNPSLYSDYRIILDRVRPSSNNVSLQMRTSTNGGSSYASGGADYNLELLEQNGAVVSVSGGNGGAVNLARSIANTAAYGVSGNIEIINPGAANYCSFTSHLVARSSNRVSMALMSGRRDDQADVDAVQFFFSSGNIDAGTIRFYGLTI